MRKLSRSKKYEYLVIGFSFMIPCLVMLLSYIIRGIAPFGDRTLCSMDGFSQYYPMLMNMDDAISKGEVFYSFHGALGFNLWAQSAYYTNSPLWLIVYLVPHSMQITAIHFLVLLKISLAGAFFALFLIKHHGAMQEKKAPELYIALSCAWALSGYMTAFINQLMWTDVVVLLPLVIFGLETMCEKKRSLLYIIALFLSIWSCFYLSFMVCIFCGLYFLFLLFKEKAKIKQRINLCLRFGFSSLTAGAMAGVSLLPVAKALSLTAASDMGFSGKVEFKYDFVKLLMRFLPFQETSLEYGEPNLYCSVIAVVLVLFYFLFSKSSKREKLLYFIFISFMFVSMCTNLGEYIWHGFHFPNQLPARQSFLVIFLLLTIASEGVKDLDFKKGAASFLAVTIICAVSTNAIYHMLSQVWASKVSSLQRYEETMEEFTSKSDDELFSRLEWTDEKKNNYPQQYAYNGISYYSSTMSADAYEFFQSLGMERYAKNVSTYYNHSQILDCLFGVKYILQKDGDDITENDNALPIAYLSNKAVLSLNLSEYDSGTQAQQALWDSIVLSENDFDSQVNELKDNSIVLTYFDTDVIKGTINCDKDGVLLTTLPYDGGWEIYIDGERVETQKAAGYLTSAEITKGSHEIEMRYMVPWLSLGIMVSLMGIIGLAVIVKRERKKNKLAISS